ncbi:DNA cytosine methyltransferase [Lactococcus lactis]|uniref:DNA cytosine methyltransferase n=1 Tax=Lactococcus lactis TaxID=1358 RepID=UPI0024A89D8B|nr:DNA (cytosine-5-)-methyltransferase [Lactococcus lactis]
MKFLDLFAGIGGFRLGLEQAGHECVGFCEIDKFARQSYKAIHNTEGEREYHDITTVSNEEWRTLRGTVELICGGFPCQAFSIAGKRKGFLDETRGTLFFEIARAAEQIKPRTLFLENVRGLLSHDKNFGVPQNRERVFIIGHLRGERGREVFPIGESNRENTFVQGQQVLANTLTTRVDAIGTGTYVTECEQHENGLIRVKEATKKGFAIADLGDSINLSVPNSKTRRGRVGKQVAQTLDTSCNQAVIVQKPRGFNKGGEHEVAPTLSSNSWHENNLLKSGIRIRKLTPRECWRLQGFPDWAFDKAQEVNSNSQLYKQAGNSVTVPVIYEIARRFE